MTATAVRARPVEHEDTGGFSARQFGRIVWDLVWPIVVAVVAVVICWYLFLEIFSVDSSLGKTPQAVFSYLFTDSGAGGHRSAVFSALRDTLYDAVLGYLGGMIAALVVAALFTMFAPVEQAFMPIAMLLRSVPLVALTPIIILIFKRGQLSTAVIGGIVVFFPALVNIIFGLRSSSRQTVDLVVAYGGTRWTVIRKVAVPQALPAIFASARISVPGALIGALVAEWLATGRGIGGTILNAIGGFDYGQVWSDIVLLTGTSLILYTIVGIVESLVLAAYGPDAGKR